METLLPPMNPAVAHLRRQSAHRKYTQRMRYVRLLWLVAFVVLGLVLAEVVVTLCVSPRFWIYRLEVRGTDTLPAQEVIRLAAIPPQSNWCRTSLTEVAARVRQDARVAGVSVRRGAVGVLLIEVTERQAVCRIGFERPPRYLDAQGVIFWRPVAPSGGVPVVEGLALPRRVRGGVRMTDARTRQALACLREVRLVAEDGPTLEVTRVIVGVHDRLTLVLRSGTRIILGWPRDLRAKLWVAQKTIVQASTAGYALDQLDYIDVKVITAPTDIGAAYRPKPALKESPP
jgi:hypothetical protein